MMTLDGIKDQFIGNLASQKKASATVIAYKKDIEQLLEYLGSQNIASFDQVTEEQLNKFLEKLGSLGFTPKTISRKINSLKTFYRFLVAQKHVKSNVATMVAHPKFENKPPRVLSRMEYRALRDASRDDLRIAAVVELLLQTGMRIGELASLTTGSVSDSFIKVPTIEGHPEREIPLNKPAKSALDKYLAVRPKVKTDALFVTKTGRPLLIRNVRTAIDRYFRIAGIRDAKVNDLRHTFIVHHLAAGASPLLVSKLVGHKRISTTERYLELTKGVQIEKAKLEEL